MDKDFVKRAVELSNKESPKYIKDIFKTTSYIWGRTAARMYNDYDLRKPLLKLSLKNKVAYEDVQSLALAIKKIEEKTFVNSAVGIQAMLASGFDYYGNPKSKKNMVQRVVDGRDPQLFKTSVELIMQGIFANDSIYRSPDCIIVSKETHQFIKDNFMTAKTLSRCGEVIMNLPYSSDAVYMFVSEFCPKDQIMFINTDSWEYHYYDEWQYSSTEDMFIKWGTYICLEPCANGILIVKN